MRKTTDIIYFVEHVARELDIACIVKCICESQYKLKLKIVSLPYDASTIVNTCQPRLVIMPYFYSIDTDPFLPIIVSNWKNAIYFNLYYEQFLSRVNKEFKAPKGQFAKETVYHHAWGNFTRDYLIQNNVNQERIFVNGNPSYMLYLKPYSNYFPDRKALSEKYSLCLNKKWLFFPMNYFWAFLSDKQIKEYIQTGYSPSIAYENRDLCQKSLHEVILWWKEAAKNSNLELIVRPRPATPLRSYIEKFNEIIGDVPKGIHIIKEGSIREWILASDIVMSSFSTSLLDASVANKPAYILEPFKFPDWLSSDWFNLLPHICEKESFIDICSKLPESSVSCQAKKYIYQNSLGKGDAIFNIAKIINDLYQSAEDSSYITDMANHLKYIRYKLRANKEKKICDILENDIFTEYDVAKKVKEWQNILK